MGRRVVWGLIALVVLGCGDDDEPEPRVQGSEAQAPDPRSPAVEPELEPEPEPEPGPAAMVVLVEEKALELRSTASPNEGEPWAAEREPAGDALVLVGATASHVLVQQVAIDPEDFTMPFVVVPRGGNAAAPVTAARAHLAPEGDRWIVERPYERFHCGGMARGRHAFVRTLGRDEERAIGEGFVGFGPSGTVLLQVTMADCGPGGGLRNHQSFIRMAPYAEAPAPTGQPGGIGEAGDDPNGRLAFHPAPWIDASPVPIEVESEPFGPKCFLQLGGERIRLIGPACQQPESAGFSADGSHYAFVVHGEGQATLWVVERATDEIRKVPLGPAGDAGAMPGICGGPDGERWLVTRPDAVVVAVNGTEVSELESGLCLGAAPGGHIWAVQLGARIELRDASDSTAAGTVLEGVTGMRWLPPSE